MAYKSAGNMIQINMLQRNDEISFLPKQVDYTAIRVARHYRGDVANPSNKQRALRPDGW